MTSRRCDSTAHVQLMVHESRLVLDQLVFEYRDTNRPRLALSLRDVDTSDRLMEEVALRALEHHEKLDGSGYPKGLQKISFHGQLIGIVDCYEALTNEDRPYRRAKDPLDTLKLLKGDVESGKFNRELFEKFCYSLM